MALQMPEPEKDGHWVRTLNNMGLMATKIDHYMQRFIDISPDAPGPVLDIGAAYGIATLAALDKGAKKVIANDIDPRHLEILMQRVPQQHKDKIELLPGEFPDGLDMKPESLGAILAARVFHFFPPAVLLRAIRKAYEWLAKGGRLVITAETPYLGNWKTFTPIYENRKKEGNPWPGFVEDVQKYEDGIFASILPKQMHMLDVDVLRRVLEEAGEEILRGIIAETWPRYSARDWLHYGRDIQLEIGVIIVVYLVQITGFIVEEIGTFARPEFASALQLDGRESCGVVARKP